MRPIDRLLSIMSTLRHPEHGCAWDREQNFSTISPYTIEEAYEVADAIDQGDMAALREELGDLLLQVVFHSRMAEEEGHFAFDDVANAIADKMIRRHPHVFAEADIRTAEQQTAAWEEQKAQERQDYGHDSLLDGVARTLPALIRSVKLQKRAARVGFDWPDAKAVLDKLAEEVAEVQAELDAPCVDQDRLEDEIGDLLFVVSNLARKVQIDPEQALKRANQKFDRRFRHIEKGLAQQGRTPQQASLDEMESLWCQAKQQEKQTGG